MTEPVCRTLSEDLLESVRQLHNETCRYDTLDLETFRHKTLEDPDFDPALAPVLLEAGRPVAWMMAVCRREEDRVRAGIKMFGVAPDWQGRGLANRLLGQVEAGCLARGALALDVGFTRPNYLTAGIDPRYTPAVAFLMRRGYQRTGETFNMDVDLSTSDWQAPELEEKLGSQGIVCRRLGPEDRGALEACFDREGTSAGWRYQILRAASLEPPRVFIAEREGEVVAFAAFDAVRPGWFGPMATSTALRGGGIGTLVYLRCLQDMKSLGYRVAVINAVGPLPFYSRVSGAVVSRVFWRMSKQLASPHSKA